ncbi:MAG: cytochrome C oxidase subunit IV family protein [Cytophagales bacterium]
MSHSHSEVLESVVISDKTPESVAHRKTIWATFYILLAITAFEFVIAFLKGPMGMPKLLVITIFVTLTLVKAFYIVAEFMHLKGEAKGLIMSIVIPVAFIIWLLVALLTEGGAMITRWFH